MRSNKNRFVIFKNILDNNYTEDDTLSYWRELLNPDEIKEQLELDGIVAFRIGEFDSSQPLSHLLRVKFENIDDAQFIIHYYKNFEFSDNITCISNETFI